MKTLDRESEQLIYQTYIKPYDKKIWSDRTKVFEAITISDVLELSKDDQEYILIWINNKLQKRNN